ncbi:LysM peptidoglycan-binding domain-containing protein [Peribacillus cavernae]|uniref:LysM peptidoglycan-binding domain-containing protein n=1 Tax=Peribacillus cavernae TaxID=1674310 RepID=A0A433HKG6_9BACI|nr:3D domain-containing protein [Peribacillus cavernae]MDQ0219104.1 3D (Asp-Asp-Asp) domain-containing protein [Peribacillus cavernae]RUQ28663.1 LysM peptidoglycan-binding domain-containing protein [Peribacillus cavernae]
MKKILLYITSAIFLVFGFSGAASAAGTYQVKSGDTLWGIAKKNKVAVSQIKSWNKLKSDLIMPKQVLKLSGTATKTAAKKPAVKAASSSKTAYKTITVKATAYTASCKGCSGITATGLNLKKNPSAKAISVDPKVIPLGSKVYVEGYGQAVASDTGGAIKGNKIDVFVPSKSKAIKWGVKTVKVKVYK